MKLNVVWLVAGMGLLASACLEPYELAGTSEDDPEVDVVESEVNGGVVARDFLYPWSVRVGDCGGVVLARSWVLTAAHCLVANPTIQPLVTWSRVDPTTGITHSFSQRAYASWRHPEFDPAGLFYRGRFDLGLLRMWPPMTTGRLLQTAALPGSFAFVGEMGEYANFRHLGSLPQDQVAVFRGSVVAADADGCRASDSDFCALSSNAGVCEGDSGSGFTAIREGRATVLGVVSWGKGACEDSVGELVGFADVRGSLPWIVSTVAANSPTGGALENGRVRVRWSGQASHGMMKAKCVVDGLTRTAPMNVPGVEASLDCPTILGTGTGSTLACEMIDPAGKQEIKSFKERIYKLDGTLLATYSRSFSPTGVVYYFPKPSHDRIHEFTCEVWTKPVLPPATN